MNISFRTLILDLSPRILVGTNIKPGEGGVKKHRIQSAGGIGRRYKSLHEIWREPGGGSWPATRTSSGPDVLLAPSRGRDFDRYPSFALRTRARDLEPTYPHIESAPEGPRSPQR